MSNIPKARSPRAPQQSTSPDRSFLAAVKSKGSGLPNRNVLHGVEGVGKTSFGAMAPKPIFIQSMGETGLDTLIDSNQLPPTDHYPQFELWEDVLAAVRELIDGEHEYKSLVIDTMNGLERLCHEHVCRRDFNDDWSERGFMGYMRGYQVATADWREFLNLLDRLRTERKMSLLCLVHTAIARFSNPEGADFDRYVPDMHPKTWGLTQKWADNVFFATFFQTTSKEGGKEKGKGGQERVLYTQRHAAYDAKSRTGLPAEISFGPTVEDAWNNFAEAVRAARSGSEEAA